RNDIANSLFCDLFSDPKRALSLYNAINGTSYDNYDDLQIVTLSDVMFLHKRNDVSILFDSRLTLWEHQSSVNPNMPLRGLQYFSRNIDGIIGDPKKIHRKNLINIPAPAYYVLYNGREDQPERSVLKLSDSFEIPVPGYEWTATVININSDKNRELLAKCPELKAYAMLVGKIRELADKGESREKAVDSAVEWCISQGYLIDYLRKKRMEAKQMIMLDIDEEAYMEALKEDAREEGLAQGISQGISQGEERKIIEQICKKLRKNKTIEQIADELEEEVSYVASVCKAASGFAPEYDFEKVVEAIVK
nr:transposase [Lachnospiraceae bacterium]